jgi:D-proline reductase (dithiol) PrdB
MSHVSINHDRNGYRRDLNVIYPIDRLRELAEEGVIGSVADTHFSVMGSTDPAAMVASADGIAARCMPIVSTPLFCAPFDRCAPAP